MLVSHKYSNVSQLYADSLLWMFAASSPTCLPHFLEYERLMNVDMYNEDNAVESVLDQLRSKEVVKADFLLDLGDIGGKPTRPQQRKDPAVKMNLRQAQVDFRDKTELYDSVYWYKANRLRMC